jgi:transcription initiation factor IIE alpha subunit
VRIFYKQDLTTLLERTKIRRKGIREIMQIMKNKKHISKKEKQEAHFLYLNWKIDEYELADLLVSSYDKIGAYIMKHGLWRTKNEAV